MTKKSHNVNILTLNELESKEINNIIDLAIDLKKQQKKGKEKPLLQDKMKTFCYFSLVIANFTQLGHFKCINNM